MTPELVVLPEIKEALLPLRPEEREALEASVLAEGIRDPLVVWRRGEELVLLDGHHRYELAQKHGPSFTVVEKEFSSLEEALAWVDQNQLARRNLTDEQRALVLGRIYEREKRQGARTDLTCGQNDHKLETGSAATARKVAAEFGVGEKTVCRAAEFAKALEAAREIHPAAAEAILAGRVRDALTNLPRLVELPPEEARAALEKVAQGESKLTRAISHAKREALVSRRAPLEGETWRLLVSDVRDLAGKLEPESVDAIVTDPPYSPEALPLYAALAELAGAVLKPGGVLAVMTGTLVLPDALDVIRNAGLWYCWTIAYLVFGPNAKFFKENVVQMWKPVVLFGKGERRKLGLVDVVKSNAREKDFHHWGQSVGGLRALVEQLTLPGELVLDPFLGGGSTPVAAVLAGRRFVAADIDESCVRVTAARLEELNRRRAAGE